MSPNYRNPELIYETNVKRGETRVVQPCTSCTKNPICLHFLHLKSNFPTLPALKIWFPCTKKQIFLRLRIYAHTEATRLGPSIFSYKFWSQWVNLKEMKVSPTRLNLTHIRTFWMVLKPKISQFVKSPVMSLYYYWETMIFFIDFINNVM